MGRVRLRPTPPPQMRRRSCRGLGLQQASVRVKCSPSKSTWSSVRSRRMTWMPSSRMSRRFPRGEEGDAVGAVFVLVPAGADAQLDAAAAEVVHGGQGVREDGGMAIVHAQHERADAQVLRLAGEGGHDGRALPVVAVVLVHEGGLVEVVGGVDPVEAGGIGPGPETAKLRHLDVLLDQDEPQTSFDCSFVCCASLRAHSRAQAPTAPSTAPLPLRAHSRADAPDCSLDCSAFASRSLAGLTPPTAPSTAPLPLRVHSRAGAHDSPPPYWWRGV